MTVRHSLRTAVAALAAVAALSLTTVGGSSVADPGTAGRTPGATTNVRDLPVCC